jgi:DNA-directed RNA polymerase subunit M/transcription elongation factor TFIIS
LRQYLDYCPRCGDELKVAEARFDARGIFITYACDKCWQEEKKKYRPEVLSDPNYECDEPIEPEDY